MARPLGLLSGSVSVARTAVLLLVPVLHVELVGLTSCARALSRIVLVDDVVQDFRDGCWPLAERRVGSSRIDLPVPTMV